MIHSLRSLLLILTTGLFLADLAQSLLYLPEADRREGGEHLPHGIFYACFFIFFGAMLFALWAPSLPLMWVAIELTTLVSAPLIAYHRSPGALEAMWKYLLICSIGIGLALFGTMLVLHAQTTGHAMWYKAGFVFILAGYGTKTGLAPFHTWLPDAHSEAPAPVSALLSGALLNCSFFAIARFRLEIPDSVAPFCDGAMLTLGLLSLAIAAVFMVRQTDYKRLLAYSSVEHMGLVTILFALGLRAGESRLLTLALFAHIVTHSLTKTMLFQTAGNLLLAYGTRAVASVQGLGTTLGGHAAIWICGILFICGMPPSILFLSELGLVVSAPLWLAAATLFLLFCVFAAMMKIALSMTMGRSVQKPQPLPGRFLVVPGLLLLFLIAGGVHACVKVALAF